MVVDSTALFVGEVIATTGVAGTTSTLMFTGPEVAESPLAAVALAVSTWIPDVKVRVILYGEELSDPSEVPPSKNSTDEIVEPTTDADAIISTVAGAVNEALFAGEVILTVGGRGAVGLLLAFPGFVTCPPAVG